MKAREPDALEIPTIACVVAARPNFMKMASVIESLRRRDTVRAVLVHTGQHYDESMSRVFFDELGMPAPDVNLEVGSGSHAAQTARILERFDDWLQAERPDVVLVSGDVNSTLACALAAAKRAIPVGHVESGLRSRDRTMPEELNRLLTDAISDLLFTTSEDATENLQREGIDPATIHLVGNSMIDPLRRHLNAARSRRVPESFGLDREGYVVVTLHRPGNVDDPERLSGILAALDSLGLELPVIFPVHPRTAARIGDRAELRRLEPSAESMRERRPKGARGLTLVPPLGYLDFLGLMEAARLVLTDSGGIQEETTALGVRCLTLRDTTERPVTISEGTNRLIGSDPTVILPAAREAIAEGPLEPRVPPGWDGHAGERIAEIVERYARAKSGVGSPSKALPSAV